MKRWIWVLVAFCPAANAQQVYKCVSGKDVSYQSSPCAGPAAKTWDAVPVPEPSNAEQWRQYRIRQELQRRYASDRAATAAHVPTPMPGNKSPDACAAAKAQQQEVLAAAGIRRTHDLLRALDEQVTRACR